MEKELEIDNQRADEEIIFFMRQHPWVLAKTGFFLILTTIIVFLSFLIGGFNTISFAILAVGIICATITISRAWYLYANDLFILTNQRVINIDQNSFFNRKVTEAELSNILNVSHEIKGPIKSLLNFGDISIDTSGSDRNYLVLGNIENPHFVQEKIVSLQKKVQTSQGSAFSNKNTIE